MWKKLRNDKKKGFTLVELIVVLVILAILAALLIPALTGYIDKAKEKQIIAETRQTVMAAQTLVDEAYAKKNVGDALTVGDGDTNDVDINDIAALAEVDKDNIIFTASDIGKKTVGGKDIQNVVMKVVYTAHGKTCTYEVNATTGEGTYSVGETPAP